jgi:hypothetical protein
VPEGYIIEESEGTKKPKSYIFPLENQTTTIQKQSPTAAPHKVKLPEEPKKVTKVQDDIIVQSSRNNIHIIQS